MKNVRRFTLGILVLAIAVFAVAVFSENRKTRVEIGELRTRVARLETAATRLETAAEMLLSKEARFELIGREEKIK